MPHNYNIDRLSFLTKIIKFVFRKSTISKTTTKFKIKHSHFISSSGSASYELISLFAHFFNTFKPEQLSLFLILN